MRKWGLVELVFPSAGPNRRQMPQQIVAFLSVFCRWAAIIIRMNDWQLVAAYAKGDEDAFTSMVQRFFPMVFSAALRRLNDAHLAEDVAQSVFIIFARKAPKLSREVVLSGWLLRTTNFVARDALKQMKRRLQREQEASALAELEKASGWEPGWTDAVPLVDEALFALSSAEQACVIARFFEDRSFREIGEGQRISEDAAQKRVARGLEKMRSFLQRRGVKVSGVAIPAILTADVVSAAGLSLVQTPFTIVQAALKTPVAGSKALVLAERFLRQALFRQFAHTGLTLALILSLVTGGTLMFARIRPKPPPFRVSEPRIESLGRAWAQVVQRAAFLIVNFPRPPAQNDPRAAEYQQITAFVLSETTRISSELGTLLKPGAERLAMTEFLAVELIENLNLDARQSAEVFASLREPLSRGATWKDGLKALVEAKPALAAAIRSHLYGADNRGLFVLPTLVLAGN